MIIMRALLALGALSLALISVPARSAVLVDIPMDQQINIGDLTNSQSPLGDAIYIPSNFSEQMEFKTEGGDSFTRVKIAGGSWYYGPYIDFRLAGAGSLDLSGDALVEFDARYFQPDDNTNRYADAPIFLRMYSYADDNDTLLGWKDFGIVYATQPSWNNPAYPDWTHVTVDWNSAAAANNGANVFDPTKISRMRLYGTDWFSPANQFGSFIDVKNFRVTTAGQPIPEPGTMALMAMGALPLLGLRRRKA